MGEDALLKRRITAATEIIWRTAHAKRPMMTKKQARLEHRSRRVSDPNAQAGVPVRTGALQGSIKKTVEQTAFLKYQGKVETHGLPYAGYIEFGTSKMKARPFMRPAVELNKEAIKRMFKAPAEKK